MISQIKQEGVDLNITIQVDEKIVMLYAQWTFMVMLFNLSYKMLLLFYQKRNLK